MKKVVVIVVVLAAVAGAAAYWWRQHRQATPSDVLALYGNVDFRQADLPFDNSERIVQLLVEEGDRVKAGQVLGRLDTGRLMAQQAEVQATVAAQQAALQRLENGSRPEEIAQARANVEAAKADLQIARQQYDRLIAIERTDATRAVSKQEVDDARARVEAAQARLEVARQTLTLAEIGPRQEDIQEARAQLQAAQGRLEVIRQQLEDTELRAPSDGVIRARLMEPGELASPQRPVFSLAIADPKWVRAYLDEANLGRVRLGMRASVTTDTFPGREFDGWVGFISPVAEFTPKPVQTEQLRTSLVYEVRVYVRDPQDELRLGMPATVSLQLNQPTPPTLPAITPATRPGTMPATGPGTAPASQPSRGLAAATAPAFATTQPSER